MTESGENASRRRSGLYAEHADYMARRIGALSSGAPSAVLSGDALAMIQEDAELKPFRRQNLEDWSLVDMDPSELRNPEGEANERMHASLDLHVGNEMLVIEENAEPRHTCWKYKIPEEAPPKSLIIIKSREYILMPPFLAGLLVTPVRTAMSGISNISTMLDPNFEGFLILNMVNTSPWPITIAPGKIIARIVFHMIAYIGEIRVGGDYPGTHRDLRTLKAIIRHRLDQMESTLYSGELRKRLKKWVEKE